MNSIGVAEAKAKLSELLDRVERGQEVVISRYGKAIAKVMPVAPSAKIDHSAFFGSLEDKNVGW